MSKLKTVWKVMKATWQLSEDLNRVPTASPQQPKPLEEKK